MKDECQHIRHEYQNEIKQLEEWLEMSFDSIVFDSEICDWKIDTSTFDKRILQLNNIAIIIETTKGEICGGYVYSKITGNYPITDRNAFIFKLRDETNTKTFIKYDIKPNHKTNAIKVFDKSERQLLSFGRDDIVINKKSQSNKCIVTS